MRRDDLFSTSTDGERRDTTGNGLRRDLLESAIRGAIPGVVDIEFAEAAVSLLHDELGAYGTSGNTRLQGDDDDANLLIRACFCSCNRSGVEFPVLPFRDFTGFRKFWNGAGMYGSYEKRRNYLHQALGPVIARLAELSFKALTDQLESSISPLSATGWAQVNAEISQLRQRFAAAHSEQDYSAVGNSCVRILEHLGEVVFDQAVHVPSGHETPPRDKTKIRLETAIIHALPNGDNENLRKLARATVEVAQEVKHRKTPTRQSAAIAADSVILLVSIMRHLAD